MRNPGNLLRSVFILIFISVSVSGAAPAWASDSPQLDQLLNILVRKRILTAQEAASVRSAAAEPQTPLPAAADSSSTAPAEALAEARDRLTAPPPPQDSSIAPRENPLRLPFRISGYGQGQWTSQPGAYSTFRLRRARLRVIGDIGKMGFYWLEFDAVNSPSLLDAYATLGPKPYLKLTAGQFRIPFSQESLWSSANLPMVERSQVVNELVPGRDNGSNGRDIGADLAGTHNFTSRTGVDYAFGVFNGDGINTTADNNRKNIVARLAARPAPGLAFTGDYYHGNTGPGETSRGRGGAEYSYQWRPLMVMGEFIRGNDGTLHRHGWYALERWQFSPRWQGLFRVDSYDANTAVKNDTTSIYLGGLNWLPEKNLRFQLNVGAREQKAVWKPDLLSQMQFSF